MNDIEQKKIFANNLLHYLSISGKTQREVAKSINVSPQTFNTWTQRIALPRMGKIQALADYFNINKTDLLDKHVNIKTIDTTYIIETYTQLTPHRQEIVLDFAKYQLEEQENGTKNSMRTNEEIIDLIIQLCSEKDISISELAKRVGMAKSAISRYFNKSRQFPLNRISVFADVLNVTPEYLLGFHNSNSNNIENDIVDIISNNTDNYTPDNIIPLVTYPFLLNAANAGYGVGDEYQYIEGIQVPAKEKADFIMKVSGDSMYPTFEDGDYVYVQKTTDLCYGNIGIFFINNTYYIKEYTKNKLVSHNKNYNDIIPDEFNDIFTIGKVLGKVEN